MEHIHSKLFIFLECNDFSFRHKVDIGSRVLLSNMIQLQISGVKKIMSFNFEFVSAF